MAIWGYICRSRTSLRLREINASLKHDLQVLTKSVQFLLRAPSREQVSKCKNILKSPYAELYQGRRGE